MKTNKGILEKMITKLHPILVWHMCDKHTEDKLTYKYTVFVKDEMMNQK